MVKVTFDASRAGELLGLLREGVDAGMRLDGHAADAVVERLGRFPFDATSTAMAVMLSRRLASARTALLLSVQADLAPATTLLRRTAGQLFLLAGQLLAESSPPDAPLVALQTMSRELEAAQLLHGGLWALTLVERCATGPSRVSGPPAAGLTGVMGT